MGGLADDREGSPGARRWYDILRTCVAAPAKRQVALERVGGAAWRDSLGPGACDGDKTIWGRGRALAGQSWVRVPAGARGYLPTVDSTSRVRWEKLVICFATRFSWRRHQVANQRLTVA